MPKHIFFNGRFLAQPLTGVQRYAIEVLKALDMLIACGRIDASGMRLEVLTPPEPCSPLPLKHITVRQVGRMRGNLWEQMDLAWHARSGLLVDLGNIGPVLHPNQVVTIHDASVFAVPEAYSPAFRLKYQMIFWILGRTARRVFTDSLFSKAEIIRYCGIPADKIQVVVLGKEHILNVPSDPGIFKKYSLGSKPYILAVSSNSPHKNFSCLVKAIESMGSTEFEVVIVGGSFAKVFRSSDLHPPESVRKIGYVNDSELRALYERAVCFVYPSYYEGFGLPPLEAMTVGCPVVVSRAASLPEVCGDAALYFDPRDPADMARQILRIVHDPVLQASLKQKQQERIQMFTWTRTAQEIWDEVLRYAV